MTPDFNAMLAGSIVYGLVTLAFLTWRFGGADALAFVILSGGFTALLDMLNAYGAHTYEYPGQTPLWVFAFIFFGWLGVSGSCLLLAEGILARPGSDLLTDARLAWQVPLLAGIVSVVLDLFVDPVAVGAGYWVWLVKGNLYFGIPVLNFVGWFVLMALAPLAWTWIARHRQWAAPKKISLALGAVLPLGVAAIVLSVLLNGAIAVLGFV